MTHRKPEDSGGFDTGNINEDLTKIPDLKDTINDSEFWGNVQNQELENSEDERNPSPPNYKLTKKILKIMIFLKHNCNHSSLKIGKLKQKL